MSQIFDELNINKLDINERLTTFLQAPDAYFYGH
jgi:hypothetical protein